MEASAGITVSGLLVTPIDPGAADALAAALAEVPGCALERAVAGRFVVTAETRGAAEGRELVERLQALEGVRSVDVVFVADLPEGADHTFGGAS